MQREQFLAQPEIESFIAWLAANLPTLTFKLRFKSSKFVPGGLTADVQGIEQVLGHYRWKASLAGLLTNARWIHAPGLNPTLSRATSRMADECGQSGE